MRRFIVALACLVLTPGSGALETVEGIAPEKLFPGARFAPEVPTQRAATGIEHGARPLRHAELMRYLEALVQASKRARIVEYARSHEGRPLVYFAVGSEATIATLDGFRDAHARRMDPRSGGSDDDLATAPAVAWMAYGIHGDELSSVDAAAALAYWLVAGEDERAARIRQELLVLIDPCENPDGRERFLAQTSAFAHALPNPDPEDLSHTAVWPWGRGNHYLFDLNRDWFTMVHPESRRSAEIARWAPQLVVDSHEMGSESSYLFSPPRHPFNPHLPPYLQRWWDRFAADQARALDARGYPYFTREWNEEFFPGYGSSWASYLGAIGILYEMSGTDGTLIRQPSGKTRTFPQAVEHHVTSSVANLETLAANRADVLRDFVEARREAMRADRPGPAAAWVLARRRNPGRADALARLLRAQGIEIWRSTAEPKVAGLRDIATGAAAEGSLEGGAWLVRLDQPAGRLARVLLDPHVPMEAPFLREEREHLERGKGTRLYDVTAWSLPLLWDVEAFWTSTLPAASGWQAAADPVEPAGTLERSARAVGYLVDGTNDAAPALLATLLQDGIQVEVAEKPFRLAGEDWPRGTLLVAREGNPADLETRLERTAARWNNRIVATPTAKAERGPDLGGDHFHALRAPRIGVWTGFPVSPGDYGSIWHLLDRMGQRFSGLDLALFGSVDLARYNVLVFPPAFGGGNAYRSRLGDDGIARLKRWIEGGGTAIGVGSGSAFLAEKDLGLTATRLRRQALDRYPPVVLGPGAGEVQEAGAFRAVGLSAPKKSKEKEDDEKKDEGRDDEKQGRRRPQSRRESPYDVAPVLGPGARPFAIGVALGTPADSDPVDLGEWVQPYLAPGRSQAEPRDLEVADERLRRFSPQGALMQLELDPEIWLTWGAPERLPALIQASDTLVAEPPITVAARFAPLDSLHLGGLLWPEAAARFARTAYLTREGIGRGQVILFLDHPDFRGWTPATRRLLQNALLYGPGLGTRGSVPW